VQLTRATVDNSTSLSPPLALGELFVSAYTYSDKVRERALLLASLTSVDVQTLWEVMTIFCVILQHAFPFAFYFYVKIYVSAEIVLHCTLTYIA
jgi:hypothetical protein